MGANKRPSRVVVVEKEMCDSPAFLELSGTAHVVLMHFLGKRQMVKRKGHPRRDTPWEIANNGEITYSYGEAEQKGITRPAFTRALDQLIDRGFIDIAQPGNGLFRSTTAYSLSNRWRAWGTEGFEEKVRSKPSRWHKRVGFQDGHTYHPPKNGAGPPAPQ